MRSSRARVAWIAIGLPMSLSGLTACEPATRAPQPATAVATAPNPRAEEVRAITATMNAERLRAADGERQNWLSHGRTYDEQRFSPLDAVNTITVADLALAWYWDTGTVRGLEATPIVVDGVMFSTGAWSVVWAHDGKTGELLWRYDPQVPREWGVNACCDVVNRGVAVWRGKVYVGTLDGRLVAVDAGSGEPVWTVLTIDPSRPYTITGAPRIVKGKVIIGNGGAEYGVRGYVTAYDAGSGEQVWRFYTVPGDPTKPFESRAMAIAAKTWRGGNWWEIGGGGTVWDSMAYDPELNLLYIGVGNGSPWNRYIRSPGGGDNLFVASIVALNPDNGTMAWYYQTTPGDTWDYTATQHMILADIEIGANLRKVIMQAPKNGFFYVLDRIDGELISADAYVPVNWASHVDLESGRPVENPAAHYLNEPKRIHPGPLGGHNWHPMTYSPVTGLVYMPTLETELRYGQDEQFEYNPATWNTGVEFGDWGRGSSSDSRFEPKGHLTAWDPVSQSPAWRVEHAGPWNGGLLSTAGGLVFQGRADCTFAAYRASDGELLWRTPTGNGIVAAPVTYEINDAQYIVVIAGWGGAFGLTRNVPCSQGTRVTAGRILAYKLGATAQLPAPEPPRPPPEPPPQSAPAQLVAEGEVLFRTHCVHCHGASTDGGVIASLRHMTPETHAAWDAVVRDGVYVRKGMIGFGDVLDQKQSAAIHAYVINAAQE